MHFRDGFVVGFSDDGQNGGKRKCFDGFFYGRGHDVGGIGHGSMPDEGEIKFSNN